tara:strand:- start:1193 stop:3877 length:2685 start_codon:yes stop_codon:yes gene_type:complete
MSEVEVTIDPASAHTTASVTNKILNSGAATTTATGFKAGSLDTDGGYRLVTSVFGNLPEKTDIYGAGVTDSNLKVVGLKLQFTITTADADDWYVVNSILNGTTTNFPTARVVWDGVDQDSSTREWWSIGTTYGDISHPTTGYAIVEQPPIAHFRPDATGAYTIDLKDYVKSASLDWGDKFHFVVRKETHADEIKYIEATGGCTLLLVYEDPEPSMPIIKLEADTDYRSSIVTMTTKPSEKDIISYLTRWKDGGYDNVDNRVGVYYDTSGSEEVSHVGGNPFATGIFKEVDGDIADGFLDTEGETDYLAVWASDMSASGVTTSAVNRTMSNVVSHSRMSCTGSLSAGTAIGEELTLTTSGFSDAGNSSAESFVKYGVNWDGEATATADSINDYTIVTLDAAATTATVKHTFHKAATYYVNVCVIDSKGFRSNFTRAAERVVAASNPVAVLRASRDTAVRAKYGDEFSVVTLSASHSYPVGSDKFVWAHKFQHDSSTPVTTYPMENDNSNFNDVTTTVKLKCNTVNCAGTVLKVYGKVSVSSDGTPNLDNDASFDHYEYQVHEVSSSDTVETFGTVAQTGGENVLFKSVDFVVVSTLDAQDATAGAVYTLADGDGNVINNKIRAAKNTDKWGGYADRVAVTCAFHTGNKTITNTGGTFLTDGFVPGDTIWVAGALEDAGNNGLFTVASVSANVITINEDTLVTGDGSDGGVSIYKVNGPTLPIASYTENAPTITCSVRQALTTQEIGHVFQDSADVTQTIRFESEEHDTLDLDTQADAGHIAIQSANLKRGGGLNSLMSLGGKSYPVGTTRTKMGTPLVSLNVRALTQTGYRQIWNLIEGGRYEWATIDSKKVDVPGTAYKQLRMRLSDGSIAKDPSMASQYTASLNFVVIGELVT